MTTSFRSLMGIVFAAMIALSLIVATTDAMGAAPRLGAGGSNFLDPGNVNSNSYFKPRPIGRLDITWE